MNLTYYEVDKTSHLVKEFYCITYSKKITPFKSTIIPWGTSSLTYIYSENQYAIIDNNKKVLKDLSVCGKFYKSYQLLVETNGYSCGFTFKPTALFKLTNLDVSEIANKLVNFNSIKPDLSNDLEMIFLKYKDNTEKLFKELDIFLNSLPIIENKETTIIDKAIEVIDKKEGLLTVLDLLEIVPFSQKTLETKFKKMVGLTPGKYIKLSRFLSLMKRYEKDQIDLKDLIYMYDYYDESHFSKDFKLFTNQTFKNFFKEDYLIVKKALIEK